MGSQPDVWVFEFGEAGEFVWGKAMGGSQYDAGYDIAGMSNGKWLLAVDTQSSDGDFGGLLINPPMAALVVMSPTWVYEEKKWWERSIPYSLLQVSDSAFVVGLDFTNNCYPPYPFPAINLRKNFYRTNARPRLEEGNMALFGTCAIPGYFPFYFFRGSSGLSTVNSQDILTAAATSDTTGGNHGSYDGFIASTKMNSNSVSWKKLAGGTGYDAFVSIAQVDETQFLAAGFSNSNDGDVSGNHGSNDVWVVKFGQVNSITGNVFLDYNSNGVQDAGEPGANNFLVESQKGSIKSSSLSQGGLFNNLVDTGTYVTRVVTTDPYYTPVPASLNSNFTSYNNIANLSFALQPVPGQRNYKINLFTMNTARPGFNIDHRLVYTNLGTDTLKNWPVKVIKDHGLTFLSASVAPISVVADTITWNISSLNPRESAAIMIQYQVAPPPAVNFGNRLISTAVIDSTGDLEPANNTSRVEQPVTGAFDPNDKNESLGGSMLLTEAVSKELTYTIRFQNTGNDTAFTVAITDTLSANLDWNTIQMRGASHSYQLQIKNGNQLKWTFDKILLVDSNRNESKSHGYIIYAIKPKAGIAAGDTVRNSASIYFDFNPPVKTNTHVTIIKAAALAVPSVSGVAASYCSIQGSQKGKINNPPVSGVTVKLDGNALAVAADSTFTFDVSALAGGAHVIDVSYSNGSETKTTTLNFNVTVAVSPDVNVGANNITAVNLIDPIIITATNAAGGGTTPLFTFAKDRTFTNILQAEGTSNVLNVAATSLQTGDNWFYVRMKTSATCFTIQTNIDSIKIALQLPAPGQPVLTGLKTEYCINGGAQKVKLSNYPAVGTGTTVTVKLDGNAVTLNMTDTSFSFTPAVGNHTIDVTYTNPTATKTTTANFTVTAAVTPDVNLSANGFTLTATNAAGGGTTPLYTFAKDRIFTNILQAESSNTTLTINPSLGDNKIYVRMKTSLTCYTQQTSIDSITITRYGSTGLIDPDYPNQTISATPNPFRSRLVISGLSTTKNYSIIIYNQRGAVTHRTKIAGSKSTTIYIPAHASGAYMINIYDETKKRMIGTMELIKQ